LFKMPDTLGIEALKESVLPVCSFGIAKSDPSMGGLTELANDREANDNQTE
jgi:hypothetical protein